MSQSRFWKDMVIFVIEDDPQNGWDHVSGYRTTAYIISPNALRVRGRTVSTFYNTVSLLRTIEQILGLPPMNQFAAAGDPMFDVFTDKSDFISFTAAANIVRLDELNPPKAKIPDPVLRRDAAVSARLDFSRVDACPEDTLNRILWRAMKGSAAPYPEWAAGLSGSLDDDKK